MSNDIVTAAVPAYLQSFVKAPGAGSNIIGGISSGSFSRISIKGARFRLQEADGAETLVNALHLDVFIVDGNPNVSKNYYAKPYNPQDIEPAAPDCFSDNGTSPSGRALSPQCLSCAACPHNVWGSKITSSGAKTKACQDSKRLAVILADNPTGAVYELRVPAASMAPMANALRQFIERGIDPSVVLFRLSFDPTAEFPKLVFAPMGYASEQQARAIMAVRGTNEVSRVIGIDDAATTPRATTSIAPQLPEPTATNVLEEVKEEPTVAKRGRKKAAPAEAPLLSGFDTQTTVVSSPAPIANVVVNPATVSDNDLDSLLSGAFKL